MKKREVIIACDFASAAETLAFLDRFEEDKPYVKIGMELYYAAGPAMVETLRDRGYKIFLDLKLHDIPNTVKKAMAVLAGLGVDMTNLHAAGGIDMMRAAIEGLTVNGVRRTRCIAVTQLTSTSEERLHDELWIPHSMEDTVLHYAGNAKAADWTAWSALRGRQVRFTKSSVRILLRSRRGYGLRTGTPGIRCGSRRRQRPGSLDRTTSWWADRSQRRMIRQRHTSGVSRNFPKTGIFEKR